MRVNALIYRPPPAQAQAQPAQAHAHAQAQEVPPPLRPLPPLRVVVEGGGGGLVFWVTPPVKEVRSPTTFEAKFCIPPTMDPAKSDPGRLGKLTPCGGKLPAVGSEDGVEGAWVVLAEPIP